MAAKSRGLNMASPSRLRGLAVCYFMKRVHQFKSGLIVIFAAISAS
ncbi:Hypothetical protein SmN45_3552 [Serratia marcescens]|nr:Hypothetical protein SmN45_3552 [Serratia marcescens]